MCEKVNLKELPGMIYGTNISLQLQPVVTLLSSVQYKKILKFKIAKNVCRVSTTSSL